MHKYEFGCQFVAAAKCFFWLASFIWTSIIALQFYLKSVEQTFCRKLIYHMISWGLPSIVITVAIYKQFLGIEIWSSDNKSCWFNDRLAMWVLFYGILCLCWLFNLLTCSGVMWERCRHASQNTLNVGQDGWTLRSHTDPNKLIFHCIIFVLCWLPLIITLAFLDGPKLHYSGLAQVWLFLVGSLVCLLGLFNTIVYGFTPEVKQYLLYKLLHYKPLPDHQIQFDSNEHGE